MIDIQAGDHIGTTFGSAAAFTANTVPFVERAVAAGGQVMVFPGGPLRDSLTGYLGHLAQRRPPLAAAARRGQMQVADSRQVQLATGRFDPVYLHQAYAAATDQAVAAGYRGLWVSVDMSWAAGVDPAALTQFEAGSFPLFTSRRLTAICQYDTRVFATAHATAACSAHPATLHGGAPLRHQRTDPATLRLSGETDLANGEAFQALLTSLRPGDTLDLTGMSFIDIAGLAAVKRLAATLPHLTIKISPTQARFLDLIPGGVDVPRQPT
jgi:hypothetical protein